MKLHTILYGHLDLKKSLIIGALFGLVSFFMTHLPPLLKPHVIPKNHRNHRPVRVRVGKFTTERCIQRSSFVAQFAGGLFFGRFFFGE